ncbi:MAG: DUF2075 domain-containing protein [Methylophaga sp.]
MLERAFYSANQSTFINEPINAILGCLAQHHSQDIVAQQSAAWLRQIEIMKTLADKLPDSHICFELLIPRVGRRVDVVLITNGIIFCLEFKVGANNYLAQDLLQTEGYGLDLHHFHEASHKLKIVPILVATQAEAIENQALVVKDHVALPLKANAKNLYVIIFNSISELGFNPPIDVEQWLKSRYKPTPTIIEAAQALYANHAVTDITRNDAGAENIALTSKTIAEIIRQAQKSKQKVICFVTGVPGAGKTLVGLDIATQFAKPDSESHAVFLSGNGPLIHVLREALAQDLVMRTKATSEPARIGDARREMESIIQNIHHFRDDMLVNLDRSPTDHVVIFDEAQRAWNARKTAGFLRERGINQLIGQSESEFLISAMDRHSDWAVIVALIGGGQEIYDGEAGLNGWFTALAGTFKNWQVYFSPNIQQAEYVGNDVDLSLLDNANAHPISELHLATAMRSFRAEKVSHFVHYVVHNQPKEAAKLASSIQPAFPIRMTRDLNQAKQWLRNQQRGMERIGILASAGAKRLKADGLFVDQKLKPEKWFLAPADDVRSSNFLEDVGTEFLVQGLELDWTIVCWDADYRYQNNQFNHYSFTGSKWNDSKQPDNQRYLQNVYRVLLSRARQGMVIYIPTGDKKDITRDPRFYDETYQYLLICGVKEI